MAEQSVSIPSGRGIAIVAPSGYVEDKDGLTRAVTYFEQRGCSIKDYTRFDTRFQRFGATDEGRAAQIHAAIDDPDVHMVIALRGGYGMSRLLPLLALARIAASRKLLVGHSDFTALQLALLNEGGAPSFCGPMISPDFGLEDISDFTMTQFWNCITHSQHRIAVRAAGNPVIDVQGVLWGGNLAMVAHLVGTRFFPRIDNGILFIEDINEHPYRIERMLVQLLHGGVLDRQQAIVLGDFSGYRLTGYDNGYDFEAMLSYIRAQTKVPVLTGLPFGHIRDKATLVNGSWTRLASNSDGFTLTMDGYPTL